MSGFAAVEVEGLRELRKALRALDDKGMTNKLKDAHHAVADVVVRDAQNRAPGVSAQAVGAAGTLRAGRTVSGASIRLGRANVPYALGAEFGAYRNQERFNVGGSPPRHGRGWNQFQPWRGSGGDAGYFFYPAIRGTREEVMRLYERELDRSFGEEGFT